MDFFNQQADALYAEDVPLTEIAKQYGTPCFVYSRATLEHHWRVFDNALSPHPHQIFYAVKANSNIALLNLLSRLGSGFDIVSQGELERVLAAKGDPTKIIFSGVGKQTCEIERALDIGIYCFNIESLAELKRIAAITKANSIRAAISFRINPNVDPQTHPYIATGLKENKFGIDDSAVLTAYQYAAEQEFLTATGIACHIGSQLTQLTPFIDALDCILHWIQRLTAIGIQLQHIDIGGGLGVCYANEEPPTPVDYANAIITKLSQHQLKLGVEPGRAIAANAGILLSRVEYIKTTPDKNFAIIDAAMNDLIRPALYNAYHAISTVNASTAIENYYDIVGPVCETGDFLAKQRLLRLRENDLIAVRSCGAYGFSMSSNYNSRRRAAEVLVDGDKVYLIRSREHYADLFYNEHLVDD